MRAEVAGHPILTKAGEVAITLSFGVSTWTDDQAEDELLAAADAALYRAKDEGRNRVAFARGAAASTGIGGAA